MKKIVDWIIVIMLITVCFPLAAVLYPFVAAYQLAYEWTVETEARLERSIEERDKGKK